MEKIIVHFSCGSQDMDIVDELIGQPTMAGHRFASILKQDKELGLLVRSKKQESKEREDG